MEDECCARAEQAVIFASFQRQRYYRQSQDRWNELARTARVVVAFADFSESPAVTGTSPVKVAVPADAPLRREWILVCAAPDYPACLTGWEFPGQQGDADAARRFEVLWSVDPQVVRDAAVICARLAESFAPGLGHLLSDLPPDPPPASADLRRAIGLLNRMTGYLERTTLRS